MAYLAQKLPSHTRVFLPKEMYKKQYSVTCSIFRALLILQAVQLPSVALMIHFYPKKGFILLCNGFTATVFPPSGTLYF